MTPPEGLRRTSFAEGAQHPDQRPCPSWCWHTTDIDMEHEVEAAHPASAVHTPYNPGMNVLASCYPGRLVPGAGVQAASLVVNLQQVGQEPPRIEVALRRWTAEQKLRFDGLLELSVEDARELRKALRHYVRMAETE